MKHSFISLVSLTFPCTFTASKINTLGEVGCLNFTCLRSPERLLTQMSFWDCLLFSLFRHLCYLAQTNHRGLQPLLIHCVLEYVSASTEALRRRHCETQKCQVIFNPQQWEKNIKHAIIIFPIMLWLNPCIQINLFHVFQSSLTEQTSHERAPRRIFTVWEI